MIGPWTRKASLALAASILVGALARAGSVEARAGFDSPYTLAQTYNTALRLVRVDMGLTITERDPTAAYLLFDYKSTESGQRVVPGSIEMLDSGRSVKVVVQLGQMPRYHEQVMSDQLAKKLREEYGEPAPRAAKGDAQPAEDTARQSTRYAARQQALRIPAGRKHRDRAAAGAQCSQEPDRTLRKAETLDQVSALPRERQRQGPVGPERRRPARQDRGAQQQLSIADPQG